MPDKNKEKRRRYREKQRAKKQGQLNSIPVGTIPLKEMEMIKKGQAAAFKKRFGRDQRPDDLMMWDPDAPGDVPVPIPFIRHCVETFEFLEMAKFPRRMLYAYAYTGFMNHPEAAGRTDIPRADIVEFEQRVEEFVEMDPDEQDAAIDRARQRVKERGAGPSEEELSARTKMAEEAATVDEDDIYYQFSIDWLGQARVRDAKQGDDPATSLGRACRKAALREFGDDFDENQFHKAFIAALVKMTVDHMARGKETVES